MGVQISCGLHSQVPQEDAVRGIEAASRGDVPQIGNTEGVLSIPPKYAVSQVIGYIKGKSAIHLARVYGERKRNFVGQHFWARGYFVSTVGRDEAVIREYIRKQEAEDTRLDQLNMWR
jgi:putative transposase